MSNIYRVDSLYGIEYFGTSKEADRSRPYGEQPESVQRLNAADECNRLREEADDIERDMNTARLLLAELLDVCPNEIIEQTAAGRNASKFIDEHPMTAATCAERDGDRSYGI